MAGQSRGEIEFYPQIIHKSSTHPPKVAFNLCRTDAIFQKVMSGCQNVGPIGVEEVGRDTTYPQVIHNLSTKSAPQYRGAFQPRFPHKNIALVYHETPFYARGKSLDKTQSDRLSFPGSSQIFRCFVGVALGADFNIYSLEK